jgi:predicted nucleic acid-binding protein
MTQLVDTNILSELVRPRPNPGVVAWARGITTISLSIITLEEITCGLEAKPNRRIEAWFDSYFESHCTFLDVTEAIARHAGHLRGNLRRRGITRTQADMLIAATASIGGLTLVTRNDRDFDGCGIALLNPFT